MKKVYAIIIIILISVVTIRVVSGQQNNSLYFFDRIPQSNQLNPAIQPACAVYVGFPALSSFEINGGNNALGISDILIQNKEANELVTPLYSKELTNQTLDKLKKNNIVYSGFQMDLASFGFKIKESYISFLISDKASIQTNIPKEMLSFAYNGIDVGQSYNFDNLGVNATYYREYSIGYSQKINDKLYFGLRGKMLFGKANVTATQTTISLNEPDWETIEISSSAKVNASIPHLNVHSDATGRPDTIKFNEFSNSSDYINDLVLLKENKGYGLDLGFQYFINDKLSLSGSLLDLGYINWKANVHNLAGGGDYSFKGIDLGQDDSVEIAKALIDTLNEVYDVTASTDPYSTLLTPKLYLGVSYAPNRFVKMSLLSRSEYVLKTFRQQLTGSLTLYPIQLFGMTVSYTMADRLYDNLGIGFVFRTGPLQMYFMSERVPLFWNRVKDNDIPFLPVYSKDVNFRMGINLVFGANPRRKLMKDQPFLE